MTTVRPLLKYGRLKSHVLRSCLKHCLLMSV